MIPVSSTALGGHRPIRPIIFRPSSAAWWSAAWESAGSASASTFPVALEPLGLGRHRVDVNVNRFNAMNAHRPPISSETWQHDPSHRGGVPYRNADVRAQFQGAGAAMETRRNLRGYPTADAPPISTIAGAGGSLPCWAGTSPAASRGGRPGGRRPSRRRHGSDDSPHLQSPPATTPGSDPGQNAGLRILWPWRRCPRRRRPRTQQPPIGTGDGQAQPQPERPRPAGLPACRPGREPASGSGPERRPETRARPGRQGAPMILTRHFVESDGRTMAKTPSPRSPAPRSPAPRSPAPRSPVAPSPLKFVGGVLIVLAATLMTAPAANAGPRPSQMTFASPEAAADALADAWRSGNKGNF